MSNVCPYCFTHNPDTQVNCLSCGAVIYVSESETFLDINHLPVGSFLNNQRYRIEKALGQGGFAITYKAIDLDQNLVVAIKELWPERAAREGTKVNWPYSISPRDKQEQIDKFKDEAEKVQQFRHPSIVKVYNYFEDNNTVYIVMDFVQGQTLYKILQTEKFLPEQRLKRYFLQLAYALKIIHEQGLLHRDIKPENIIINHEDRAVLIDFGAAREFLAGRSKNMTRIFTPGYAPPEQYSYRATRHPNADIYSLCATMYELLTGKLPTDALERINSKTSLPNTHDGLVPPRQLAPQISSLMEKIILIGMKLKVEERFQDADHLITALNGNLMSPLFIKARHLVQEGKLLDAVDIYERCLQDEPDNGAAAAERALVLLHLGDVQTETATYQALQLQPQDGRLYGILGLLNCRQGRWTEAISQLRQAVKLAADQAWIWANLAWALAKSGNWQQSEFAVNKALILDKNSGFALGLKAWIEINQQQWHSSIASASQALNYAQPSNVYSSNLQAWIYPCLILALHKTNHPQFQQTWQEYTRLWPDNAFSYGFQGWLQAKNGQWYDALAQFQPLASQTNVPFWLRLNLGITYEYLQDYQQAIALYQDCHNIDPKNPFVLFRLGTLLGQQAQRTGQQDLWSKANLYLQIAVQLQDDYAEAYHNLGWVTHHIRNSQGMIENYPQVLHNYRQAIKFYQRQNQPKFAEAIKQAFQTLGLLLTSP